MNKRSAVLVAAGLVASLVVGALAFALGVLGPAASAAGPHITVRHPKHAHVRRPQQRQASAPTSSGWSSSDGAQAAPAPTTQGPTGGNDGGTETESPEPSEPSENPEPEPTDVPSPDDPEETPPAPTPAPQPSPAPTPTSGGDDGGGDD